MFGNCDDCDAIFLGDDHDPEDRLEWALELLEPLTKKHKGIESLYKDLQIITLCSNYHEEQCPKDCSFKDCPYYKKMTWRDLK